MERLPIEMIAEVSSYLSVADVVACSTTCRAWREKFNDDLVWRRRCTLRLVEYLENTDTTVPPGLQLTEHSSLSPLSEWRSRYIRENQLWNNWRQANFRRHKVISTDGVQTHVIFYENDYLVTVVNNKVQLWDVRDEPICLMTDPCELDKTLNIDHMKMLSEDRIIFVQSSKVSVFRVSVTSSPWSLIHSFYFDERRLSEDVSEEGKSPPPDEDDESDGDDESDRKIYIYVVTGDYFLGVGDGYSRLLHIWNINTGEKLKEVICPVRNQNSYFIGIYNSHKPSSDFLLVIVEIREDAVEDCHLRIRVHFNVYNVSELRFRDFTQMRIGRVYTCMIYEPYIFIKDFFNLTIYNYKTSTLVDAKPGIGSPIVFNDNVIYVTGGRFKEFNVSTGATRQLTSFNAFPMFSIACNRFIIQIINFIDFEVFEIVGKREKQLQLRLSANNDYWLSNRVALTNSTYTKKVLVEYKVEESKHRITLLNFW